VRLSDFDFELPPEQVAKTPCSPRDHSRLLLVDRKAGGRSHHHFYDLAGILREETLLVLNNTKVLPARLIGSIGNGSLEILLLEPAKDGEWQCLVRPGKKVSREIEVTFSDGKKGVVSTSDGSFKIRFPSLSSEGFFPWLSTVGLPPIPPYLKRPPNPRDRNDYQTVYASRLGSIAAPTAGLHFTRSLMDKLKAKGIEFAEITLHVGYGTFAPIRNEQLETHQMHSEYFEIPGALFEKIRKRERKVIAIGTTTLRALESIPIHGLTGRTDLFIRPGFDFKYADGLITNFHLPQSSLLILVCAFLGMESTRNAYRDAIAHNYRFFSYGDAMAIL